MALRKGDTAIVPGMLGRVEILGLSHVRGVGQVARVRWLGGPLKGHKARIPVSLLRRDGAAPKDGPA